MEMIDKEELIELVDRFLCEIGQWQHFKSWIESQGYTMMELGFSDDED